MATTASKRETAMTSPAASYPENPVLVRIWRGAAVESQHRGAWVLASAAGEVLESRGRFDAAFYARSAVKCLQALPLLETGAAERFGYDDADLALALASHNAEPAHTERVRGILERLGLGPEHLLCGAQPPGDPATRARLRERGERPTSLHNNCSGKHAGFLTLARHLGAPVGRYLDPEGAVQRLVRSAVLDMTGLAPEALGLAVDGCSAPTFRMSLVALATAFARLANPHALPAPRRAACERMLRAVERHPELIAGRHERICTDIARVTRGRLFPKIGGEAVYAIGLRGAGRALALKIDDGAGRALHALVVELLRRHGGCTEAELAELDPWSGRRLVNWAGLEVGRTEVVA
jgi:L-asparaginase II